MGMDTQQKWGWRKKEMRSIKRKEKEGKMKQKGKKHKQEKGGS
jgi:hypothetical protein